MKILFSPSEGKNSGGDRVFDKSSLLFGDFRDEILDCYSDIINSDDSAAVKELTGLKDGVDRYIDALEHKNSMRAIERYSGVAYEYLDFHTLEDGAKEYLYSNLIIFSNLFGSIRADDYIYDYKLQQGKKIGTIAPERFYSAKATDFLDELLLDEQVLDLRAGYYDKFYKIKTPHITMKFIKNGKIVSHWAKAYRGIIAREMAIHNISSLDELIALNIDTLALSEIIEQKNSKQIIYNIL